MSWLQGANQTGEQPGSTTRTRWSSSATTALSNATGVNLDTEMTNMLNIENSYTTTAKLLTTVNSMFISPAQRRVTMHGNFDVSTLSLATAMLSRITQAQNSVDAAHHRGERPANTPTSGCSSATSRATSCRCAIRPASCNSLTTANNLTVDRI